MQKGKMLGFMNFQCGFNNNIIHLKFYDCVGYSKLKKKKENLGNDMLAIRKHILIDRSTDLTIYFAKRWEFTPRSTNCCMVALKG